MPAYDEVDREVKSDPDLDLDETLTADLDPVALRNTQSEAMQFKDTHFKESSESGGDEAALEDDSLASGLERMPDVEDVLDREAEESKAQRASLLGQAQALIASDVMAHTMSSFMATTMSGLSRLGEHVKTAAVGAAGTGQSDKITVMVRATAALQS